MGGPGFHQIKEAVQQRAEKIIAGHGNWPCRKGCDDCCRHLASPPRVSQEEWRAIAGVLAALPVAIADQARRRIRDAAGASGPVVCPLLDTDSGTCLVYEARPVACRAYGFYAERQYVLGCGRIESISHQSPEVIWGNHAALEERLRALGAAETFADWLASDTGSS